MLCRLALTMSGEHLWDGVFGNIKCCAVLIFFIHSIHIIFTMDAFFFFFYLGIWVFIFHRFHGHTLLTIACSALFKNHSLT